MKKMLKKFVKDERGLELPEYAVMAALIIALAVGVIGVLAGAIGDRLSDTAAVINDDTGAGT